MDFWETSKSLLMSFGEKGKRREGKGEGDKEREKESERIRMPDLMTDHINELSLFSFVLFRIHCSISLLHLCLYQCIVPDYELKSVVACFEFFLFSFFCFLFFSFLFFVLFCSLYLSFSSCFLSVISVRVHTKPCTTPFSSISLLSIK